MPCLARLSHRAAVTLRQLLVGRPCCSAAFGLLQRRSTAPMRRLRLLDLLIQFRRFDLGEHLIRRDAVADIGVALSHVAGGAGEHGRLGDRLDIAGQAPVRSCRRSGRPSSR